MQGSEEGKRKEKAVENKIERWRQEDGKRVIHKQIRWRKVVDEMETESREDGDRKK